MHHQDCTMSAVPVACCEMVKVATSESAFCLLWFVQFAPSVLYKYGSHSGFLRSSCCFLSIRACSSTVTYIVSHSLPDPDLAKSHTILTGPNLHYVNLS